MIVMKKDVFRKIDFVFPGKRLIDKTVISNTKAIRIILLSLTRQ